MRKKKIYSKKEIQKLLHHYNFEQIMGKICMKEDPFPDLKGNNSCKTYNFRIKAGNVQMVYSHVLVNLEARI